MNNCKLWITLGWLTLYSKTKALFTCTKNTYVSKLAYMQILPTCAKVYLPCVHITFRFVTIYKIYMFSFLLAHSDNMDAIRFRRQRRLPYCIVIWFSVGFGHDRELLMLSNDSKIVGWQGTLFNAIFITPRIRGSCISCSNVYSFC